MIYTLPQMILSATLFLWVIGGLLTLRSVYLGALVYLIILPLNYPVDVFCHLTVWFSEGYVGVSFLFLACAMLRNRDFWEKDTFSDRTLWFLCAWWFLTFLSVFYAPVRMDALKQFFRWGNIPCWYFLFLFGRKDPQSRHFFFMVFSLYALLLIGVGLLNLWVLRFGPLPDMYRSIFNDKNLLSTYIGFSFPYLFFVLKKKTPLKTYTILAWLYFLFISFNLVLARSRAACIGWIFVFLLVFFYQKIRKRFLFLGFIFLVAVLLFVPLPDMTPSEIHKNSLGVRLAGWESALHLISSSPILGHGAAAFENFSRTHDFNGTGGGYVFNDPFNIYLQIALETGLTGLAFFLLGWITRLLRSFRTKDPIKQVGVILMIFFLINGFFSLIDYAQFIFFSLALFLLRTSSPAEETHRIHPCTTQ